MKSPLSLSTIFGILTATSLVTAAPVGTVVPLASKHVVRRGFCTPGTYRCGAGFVEIWTCDAVTLLWTPAASCGWGNHCAEVEGIPSCFLGYPVFK